MYEKFLKTLKIILLLTIFQIYLISCMSGGNQQIDEQITQKQEQQGQEDQEQQEQEDQDGEEQQEDDSGELSDQNNFSNEQETKNAQNNNLSNNYQYNNNLSNYENQETTDMLNDVSGDNNISMNEGEQQNIQNNNLLGNDQNLDLSQQTTQSGQDSSLLENQNMSFGNNLESEQNIGLMDNPQNSTVDNQMGSSDLSTNSFSSGEGESDPLPNTDGIDALSNSATNESSNESSGILQETAQSDQTDLSSQKSQNMSNQPIKVILPENGTKIIYITETSTNLKELANLIYGDKFASTKLSVNTHSKVISPGTSVEYVLDDASRVFAMSYEGAAFKSITVNSQDSLIKIAQNNFGDSNKWKYLWKNNLDLIKRPDNIEIGSLIVYKDFSKSNNLSAYQNTSLSYMYNWIYNKNLIAYNRFRYLFANLII